MLVFSVPQLLADAWTLFSLVVATSKLVCREAVGKSSKKLDDDLSPGTLLSLLKAVAEVGLAPSATVGVKACAVRLLRALVETSAGTQWLAAATSQGLRTVDIGAACWSMHSIRETVGVADVLNTFVLFRSFFSTFAELGGRSLRCPLHQAPNVLPL